MSDIVHRIAIKNKHVYDCMKRSVLARDWRWGSGHAMTGWDPYRNGRACQDDIVLLVHDDNTVTYVIGSADWPEAVPWAQWCEKMTFLMNGNTCSTCRRWSCVNRKELIGACTIWHESGKTWPKSWESCPHWEHDKEDKENENNGNA